jgi:hypothetical protein
MGFCQTIRTWFSGILFLCMACLSAVTDRKLFIQSGGTSNGAAFFICDGKKYINSIDISQGE